MYLKGVTDVSLLSTKKYLFTRERERERERERRERKKKRGGESERERLECCITIKTATPGILTLSIRTLNTVVLGVIMLNVVAPTKLIRS